MRKKYVITEKTTDRVLGLGLDIDELDNGYIRLVEENRAFPPELVNVYHINVLKAIDEEYYKYCYTEEDGFYLDPNYEEEDAESVEE